MIERVPERPSMPSVQLTALVVSQIRHGRHQDERHGTDVDELLDQGQPDRRIAELEEPQGERGDHRQREVDQSLGVLRPGMRGAVVEVAKEHGHEHAGHHHQVLHRPGHDDQEHDQVGRHEQKAGARRLALGVLAAHGVGLAAVAGQRGRKVGEQLQGKDKAGHQADDGQKQVRAQQPEGPVDRRQQLAESVEHGPKSSFLARRCQPLGRRGGGAPRGKKKPLGKGGLKPRGRPCRSLRPGKRRSKTRKRSSTSSCADGNIANSPRDNQYLTILIQDRPARPCRATRPVIVLAFCTACPLK